MDSGIHQDAVDTHPWFEHATVEQRYDATGSGTGGDNVGHGTGCASIIAKAATDANETLDGSLPPVEFHDVRIFGDSGSSGMRTILDAYRYLMDESESIDLVNMSWGAQKDVSAINEPHEQLIEQGVEDVVASGNTSEDGGSPATADGAFSAGALTEDGQPTRFSSYNPEKGNPDVAAVGKDIRMARAPGTSMGRVISDEYVAASGTSFAAPYTTSAYVLARHVQARSWDRSFVKAATDIPDTPKDGGGILRVESAFEGDAPEEPNPTTDVTVWDFGVGEVAYMNAGWLPESDTAELLDETKSHVDIRFRK
jgi:subtilisin family serine protease